MIYVIAHDGGYEGYSGPIQAFKTEIEARAAATLGDNLRVFAVPEWPEPTKEWFRVEPLPDALSRASEKSP